MPGMRLASYGSSQTKVYNLIRCVIMTDVVKGKNGVRMGPGPTVPRTVLFVGPLRVMIWVYFI